MLSQPNQRLGARLAKAAFKKTGLATSSFARSSFPKPTFTTTPPRNFMFANASHFSTTTTPTANARVITPNYMPMYGLSAAIGGATALFAGRFWTPPPPIAPPEPIPPVFSTTLSKHGPLIPEELLKVEPAPTAFAPNVPPPITRREQRKLLLDLTVTVETTNITPGGEKFEWWPFNSHVPGPIVRARVGDVLEVSFTNKDPTGMEHNIDFHATDAPGGGSNALNTEQDATTRATFRLCTPGFFCYHCAVGPIGVHIGRGMFGFVIVEPEHGMPPVDKEFYIVQHEIYATQPKNAEERAEAVAEGEDPDIVDFDFEAGLAETPRYVVYNGSIGSLTGKNALQARKGDRVRLFFGNAGPNLISAFHVIGTTFDHVYRDGDLLSPPSRCIQTLAIPPCSACVAEVDFPVPGKFTIIDHSIFRVERGCVGFIEVSGDPEPTLYRPANPERPCIGCKVH